MPRIIFTVTEEMDKDLKSEADKRGAIVAELLRHYVAEGLARDTGKAKKSYKVNRGGIRPKQAHD